MRQGCKPLRAPLGLRNVRKRVPSEIVGLTRSTVDDRMALHVRYDMMRCINSAPTALVSSDNGGRRLRLPAGTACARINRLEVIAMTLSRRWRADGWLRLAPCDPANDDNQAQQPSTSATSRCVRPIAGDTQTSQWRWQTSHSVVYRSCSKLSNSQDVLRSTL